MARNDPFVPDPVGVAEDEDATFDGSESNTETVIMSGAMGNFNAEIYIEAYDGDTWVEVTQLVDNEDNLEFQAPWHTQFNRVYLKKDKRRVRFENVDDEGGTVAIEGDER